MGVSIYKRGGRLYLKYTIGDKVYRKSTKLEDTPQNRDYLKLAVIPELERKIATGEAAEEIRRKRTPLALSHYARKYCESKEHLKTFWELLAQVKIVERRFQMNVDEITRGMVKDWAQEMLRNGLSPKTVRRYINVLGAILDVAIDHEVIDRNPAAKIQLPANIEERRSREPFSKDEVDLLLERASGWFRNYLAVAFYTGARPGEILALRPEDVDLRRRTIRIERNIRQGEITTPKTRYSIRTVPIFDPLLPYLRGQLMHSGEWLFESPSGGHYYGSSKAHYHWKKLVEEVGIEWRDLYTTRHTFITHMLQSGTVSVLELAQIVGHKNAQQIMTHYARFINEQHLKIRRDIDPFGHNLDHTAVESPM
ncbi:tyrosine-type recombinase/integrase [Nitratifractor sp.]